MRSPWQQSSSRCAVARLTQAQSTLGMHCDMVARNCSRFFCQLRRLARVYARARCHGTDVRTEARPELPLLRRWPSQALCCRCNALHLFWCHISPANQIPAMVASSPLCEVCAACLSTLPGYLQRQRRGAALKQLLAAGQELRESHTTPSKQGQHCGSDWPLEVVGRAAPRMCWTTLP